jgi:hypothetical protein
MNFSLSSTAALPDAHTPVKLIRPTAKGEQGSRRFRDANGVIHTSPGQRPGKCAPKPWER